MIEIKDIEKLALLARITIPENEKAKMATDINKILEYVGQVSEAHTGASAKGGELVKTKNDHASMVRNVMREDENPHESGIFTEKLLAEAPKTEKNYVKVKKIL
jgi:aspartyl/glutamyl-tRNA(Asn/Gln) amidotransferase C subunit